VMPRDSSVAHDAYQFSAILRTLEHDCEFAIPRGEPFIRKRDELNGKIKGFVPGKTG